MRFDREDLLLYAVTDSRWLNGERLYEQVEKSTERRGNIYSAS